MNNTTSLLEEPDQDKKFYLSDLDSQMQVILSIILGTACPLGIGAEFYIIQKILRKNGKRIWDHLTLAMEE